jgi:hypothetical protein
MDSTKIEAMEIFINNGPPLYGVLDVQQDVRWESSALPRPNPRWQYTDANGHYHAHAEDDRERYPTLEAVVEQAACDGSCGGVCDGEGYSVTRYFCLICREEILPGTLSGPYRFPVPGLKSWTVEVADAVREERVSVRIEASGVVLFGVAGYGQITRDANGSRTVLQGISPLGRRKA